MPVVIFGTGQIAEVAFRYIQWEEQEEVAAFCVDRAYKTSDRFCGRPVVEWESVEGRFPPSGYQMFAPISYDSLNKRRLERFRLGKEKGYVFFSFISRDAHDKSHEIGENAFILEANVIQPGVRIGDNVVLWSGNHIGHHSALGDHVFVASQVVVSGSVIVGERCFLGVNATVRDNVHLGEACVVGAGAVVTENLDPESVLVASESRLARIPSSRLRRI